MIEYKEHKCGLHFYDPKKQGVALMQKVKKNAEVFSKRQFEGA